MKHHQIIDGGTKVGRNHWDNEHPGIYRGIPEDVYHASPLLSNSKIQPMIRKCPAAFFHNLGEPMETKEDMAIGGCFHKLLLEPAEFRERYVVGGINPKTLQSYGYDTQAFTEASDKASAAGKVLMRTQWTDKVQGMADAVLAHPDIRPILEAGGERELSMIWVDQETGEKLRARIDYKSSLKMFVDFKKTSDAGFGFDSSINQYGYIEQMSMYHDGWLALTGESNDAWLIPVEDSAPYLVGTVRFAPSGDNNYEGTETSSWLHCGRNSYRAAIRKIQECRRKGDWPGYEDRSVRVPVWYIERHGGTK